MMKLKIWSHTYSALLVAVLLVLLGGWLFAWGLDVPATLASTSSVTGTKSVSSAEVPPGSEARYSIVLHNDSGSTADFQIYDTLDERLTFVGGSVSTDPVVGFKPEPASAGSRYFTLTLYSITPGAVITVNFDAELDVTAISGDVISNMATISSATAMSVPFTTDAVTFAVGSPPIVQIYEPENGEIISDKEGEVKVVSGRVWLQDQNVFPAAPVLQPINSFGSFYTLHWSAVSEAEQYVIQEANEDTFEDASEVLVDASETSKTYTKDPGVYYYRVRSLLDYEGIPHPSRWSNVEVVTITETTVQGVPNPTQSLLDAGVQADKAITVSVSTDGGTEWYPASVSLDSSGDWWNWTYDWTLPVGDDVPVVIMARARYASGGNSTQDAITVTLRNEILPIYLPMIIRFWPPIPYTPVSISATDPGEGDEYTVSWVYGYDYPLVNNYQLQEATNDAFTENLVTMTPGSATTSKAFTDKEDDVYYYLVRAQNSAGYSNWSDVISVTVKTYTNRIYNFDNSTDGWDIARTDELGDTGQIPHPIAADGVLYHLVTGKGDYSILSSMEEGPPAPYRIRAHVDIVDGAIIDGSSYSPLNGMAYGIIFGGDAGTPCPAGRDAPDGCLSHYYRILVVYEQDAGKLHWQLTRIEYHDSDNAGRGPDLIGWQEIGHSHGATDWNTWEIHVTDDASDNIKIYFNDHHVGTATDHDYIEDRYFGTFLASTKELGGVATKWDWVHVEKIQ